ncbi:tPR repeat containing protein [Clostridium sp. CAG:768]|nr:tPR repeat containing protein [Clostridium sp. CAG:768]
MFEKFTEKAINVVSSSQESAKKLGLKKVSPELLLLALFDEAKGISLKIFKSYDITREKLVDELKKYVEVSTQPSTSIQPLPFDDEYKEILKKSLDLANKSGNPTILYEHLFLSAISDKKSNNIKILEDLGFDIYKSKSLLEKLVQKKIKRLYHPEIDENKESKENKAEETDNIFDCEESAKVFERAVSKLSTSNYEILGTEQILSSILEDKESELTKILAQYGVTSENFEEKLQKIQSRQSEYEGRQIIFTPNAFKTMNMALETAKELGSSVVLPEHIILGLLKTKRGIAYDILKELKIPENDLAHSIIKPIEKQMPETLTILRLAKEEARRLGRNIVGTEMFLLGIIGEATGIGGQVLSELEINIKDARTVVENLIGFGNEYYDKEIIFTERAKRVLETAWELAKKDHKQKIESAHMLLALTTEPDSLAMKALETLGVDAVEIKEGVKKLQEA